MTCYHFIIFCVLFVFVSVFVCGSGDIVYQSTSQKLLVSSFSIRAPSLMHCCDSFQLKLTFGLFISALALAPLNAQYGHYGLSVTSHPPTNALVFLGRGGIVGGDITSTPPSSAVPDSTLPAF